jgi:hypothetical protein
VRNRAKREEGRKGEQLVAEKNHRQLRRSQAKAYRRATQREGGNDERRAIEGPKSPTGLEHDQRQEHPKSRDDELANAEPKTDEKALPPADRVHGAKRNSKAKSQRPSERSGRHPDQVALILI